MKATNYIKAWLVAAICTAACAACSDNELVENPIQTEQPAQPQEIYLSAGISDAQTRVSYEQSGLNMKVQWENNDFLMVFPGKTQRSQIKLSSHDLTDDEKAALTDIFEYDNEKETYKIIAGKKYTSDKAYEFQIIPGENGERCTFKYTGNMIWYEESESTEDYQVSSAGNSSVTNTQILKKSHVVVSKKVSEVPGASELNIVEGFTALALWEHPDNESGDCQTANNSTEHLKYQEVLTAQLKYTDFTTSGTEMKASITMTHPKTVIFKIIMNQFLYDIHRGSHVGIKALTESNENGFLTYDDSHFIDGVYHQSRSEFFEYNQTVEPAKILTVTPIENGLGYGETEKDGKIFAGDLEHTLTTYIMVDASKLEGYQAFQFSLTDNWSHDLYIWRLKLSAPLTGSETGKFFTVDLTNRVCNQFVWMGNEDCVWAIRNHKANRIEQEGGYYRYGELTPVMTNPTDEEFNSKCDEMTPDNYGHQDWLTTLTALTGGEGEGASLEKVDNSYYRFKTDALPTFLIETGEKLNVSGRDYIDTRIDYKYDAVYKDTKGLELIPHTILSSFILNNLAGTETSFNGVEGTIITNSKNHKIFFPAAKRGRPSTWTTNTNIEYEETKKLLIYNSSYAINTLRANLSNVSFVTQIYPDAPTGKATLAKKAIYHAFALRGVAKMLHKGERAATGEVTFSDEETIGGSGN